MSVVINDFEIIPVPAPRPAEASAPATPVAPAPLSPRDIAHVMRRLNERLARVRAH
jgi:hypothetical protein